jgi:hypothetical protein
MGKQLSLLLGNININHDMAKYQNLKNYTYGLKRLMTVCNYPMVAFHVTALMFLIETKWSTSKLRDDRVELI